VPAAELCREHGMSSATLYKWRAKYGGMDASLITEMKAMAEENRRLKRMYADASMQNDLLKEALGKNNTTIHCPAVACLQTMGGSAPRVGRESGGDEGGKFVPQSWCWPSCSAPILFTGPTKLRLEPVLPNAAKVLDGSY